MVSWTDFLDARAPAGRYLRWKEVERTTGLSRTTAWRLQRKGDFPRPYVISPGRVGYLESEVEAWRASRRHRSAQDDQRTGSLRVASAGHDEGPPRTPVSRAGASPPRVRSPADETRSMRRGPRERGRLDPPGTQQITFDF